MIDGRNRLAACQLVGVEPDIHYIESDINTFINSANNVRRELTKGQKAMSYAVMFPDKYDKSLPEVSIPSVQKMVSQSRTILTYRPDLQAEVLSKAIGLNEAYELAKQSKFKQEELAEQTNDTSEHICFSVPCDPFYSVGKFRYLLRILVMVNTDSGHREHLFNPRIGPELFLP